MDPILPVPEYIYGTTIGAASAPDLSRQIAALHTRWSDEKDRHAPEWSM